MTISRKRFLQLSTLTATSLLVPKFLRAFDGHSPQTDSAGGRILVVLQLSGGNDGLNTIIPYRNDIYYRSRPQLAIPAADAIALTEELGMHPALKGLKALYDAGALAILNGIGYPQPDRSHFRSMHIWQTGHRAGEGVTTGWLGRYLDQTVAGHEPDRAIELDDSLSLSVRGQLQEALAFGDPLTAQAMHIPDYLHKTPAVHGAAAAYLRGHYKQAASSVAYPDTPLASRFRSIATLIKAGAGTRVYYLSHGSFDTHVDQMDRQKQLFTQMDEALTAFVADMKAGNRMNDVLIVTFSEFGRRVAQNASQGTDHGTAGNMLVIGSRLKRAGIYNPLPRLDDLDDGDLKYHTDFRQVYATLLDKWLGADAGAVLGGRYEQLAFI